MTPQEFVNTYGQDAVDNKEPQVPALFTLGECALETGWAKAIVGNMMFGVKAPEGTPDDQRQLVTTTEYHSDDTHKYPVILSITEVAPGRYKYLVKDWFRKFDTPAQSFQEHADFLRENERYKAAFNYCKSPYLFAIEICKAGYATDPNYAKTITAVMRMIEPLLPATAVSETTATA